jgi:hypothetical protein
MAVLAKWRRMVVVWVWVLRKERLGRNSKN